MKYEDVARNYLKCSIEERRHIVLSRRRERELSFGRELNTLQLKAAKRGRKGSKT